MYTHTHMHTYIYTESFIYINYLGKSLAIIIP